MLKTRIITAIIALIALAIVLFVVPGRVAEAFIAAVILAGAWEWSAFLLAPSAMARALFVVAIGAAIAALYTILPQYAGLTLQLACLWWFCAFIWILFFPTPIPRIVRWTAGALVLVPMFVALLLLYRMGAEVLLFALLIVWAADAGAFFAGKRFGRVKLAPNISPGKTWEGVFGGLFVVTLLAIAAAYWTSNQVIVVLPFCLAVAAISIVGDLTVSMFKRTAGLKDSGKLFPGHGGVLDRVDSVAAAAPLFALGISWLGLLS